jgi:hypothetical protein
MNFPYSVEVYDNLINPIIHKKIWSYIKGLEFHGVWAQEPMIEFQYTLDSPKNPNDWMIYQSFGKKPILHRVALASDEPSLKSIHAPIYLLWKELNRQLDNRFELTGNPEGMYTTKNIPDPIDTNLTPGWRAYINANYNSHASRGGQGYAHRDTPLELNDEKTVSILYVANTEWYPSWAGELKFYPEDPTGSTGDHQQFNGSGNQQRGYNIGWLDKGRIVSPVPGRLIIYDGRCLHSTTPAAGPLDTPSVKIMFRAKRK